MKKLLISFTLFITFCLSCTYAVVADFSDIDNHWARNYILDMHNKGYVNGYEDNTFKPDKEVTREEFAQMIYNTKTQDYSKFDTVNYYDVPLTRWSYDAVQMIGHSLNESSDGYVYFKPTRPIERQEVAKVLSDYFKLEADVSKLNYPEELSQSSLDKKLLHELQENIKFQDVDDIKPEYVESVYNVYNSNYMKGVSDTKFSPTSSLTRAQAAVLLYRIINQTVPGEEPEEPQLATNEFDLSFLKLENKKENLIYSPLSIKYALKMLNEGADRNTKSQIDNLVADFNLTKYNNIKDVLSLANSVFIRDIYSPYIKEDFRNTLISKYNAEVIIDEFKNAQNVNNWISNKTFNIIENMIKDDIVQDPDTAMLLINALAIDMKWRSSFDTASTGGGEFTKENGETITATTMTKKLSTYCDGFYIDDNVVSVSLGLDEYEGMDSPLTFTAIMPKNESLSEYISKINTSDLKNIINNSKMNRENVVNLYIPKFSYEYELKLKDDLISLGMTDAFDREVADFNKISIPPVRLCVSDALHKAKIDFTEEGVKAAAVTVMVMANDTAFKDMPQPINIEFNKPFLFVISDKANDEIWFIGTVYEPNLWEKDMSEYHR